MGCCSCWVGKSDTYVQQINFSMLCFVLSVGNQCLLYMCFKFTLIMLCPVSDIPVILSH